jgi:galactose mutarotase-like enzyme
MSETEIVDWHGETAHVLRDSRGARAHVVPAVGANCIAFSTLVLGRRTHLISTPSSAEVLRERPTFWGFPILAPYPGRHVTPFLWEGSSISVATVERPGVMLHGFVARMPWKVVGSGPDFVTCAFDTEAMPNREDAWPFPFRATVTHRVASGRLTMSIEIQNLATVPVPHLLGLHPYLPLRFTQSVDTADDEALPTAAELVGPDSGATRETCAPWVRADDWWEMQAGLGTGVVKALDTEAGSPFDLRSGRTVAELERSLAWGGTPGVIPMGTAPRLPVLLYGDRAALAGAAVGHDPWVTGGVITGIDDRDSGIRATLDTSAAFGANALFCPPGFPFVSLEPRSAVSNALGLLTSHPTLHTGIYRLEADQTWRAWASLGATTL